jgi:hypothetical protein
LNLAVIIENDQRSRQSIIAIDHTQVLRAYERTFVFDADSSARIDEEADKMLREQMSNFLIHGDPQVTCPACRRRLEHKEDCQLCGQQAATGFLCAPCLRRGEQFPDTREQSNDVDVVPTTTSHYLPLPVISEDMQLAISGNIRLLVDGPDGNSPIEFTDGQGLPYRAMLITLFQTTLQAIGEQSRRLLPNDGDQDLTGPNRSFVKINVEHANDAGPDVANDEERFAP